MRIRVVAFLLLVTAVCGCERWNKEQRAREARADYEATFPGLADAGSGPGPQRTPEVRRVEAQADTEESPPPDVCVATRERRVEAVKASIREWHALVARVAPYEKFLDRCRLEDTRGTLYQTEYTKDGVIVRTRDVGKEAEIKCASPFPKGLDKDTAEEVLLLVRAKDSVLYDGDWYEQNGECRASDQVAGYDLFLVVGDIAGQRQLLKQE